MFPATLNSGYSFQHLLLFYFFTEQHFPHALLKQILSDHGLDSKSNKKAAYIYVTSPASL